MLSYIINCIKTILYILVSIIKWIHTIYWLTSNYKVIQIDRSYAKKLKNKLNNLGILGIKFGQYICTRSDITTDIMKEELKVFLNNNTLHSIKDTNIILEKAGIINNITLGEVIGSGSFAQVYQCVYQNRNLVIKVNHPNINNLKYEIVAIESIIKVLSCFNKFKFFINIDWKQFFNMIEKQIDLNNEKKYMEKYYSIYNNKQNDITIPQYIIGNEDYIIMTFCEGKPLNTYSRDSDIYKNAHNLFAISTIHTFFAHQIVHGDIHEGNILVRDDGTISIIDFGICIELIENEYTGIFAISQFENNPTIDNMRKAIIALIEPKDIYNNPINIEISTQNVYNDYMKIYNINKLSFNNTFTIIIDIFKKYNILIKNNTLFYFINMVLIEGLSPYNINKLSIGIASFYMMKNNFYRNECNTFLEDYYTDIMKDLSPEIIDKYNLKI
jgi:predicted unusual protein kinase regulating ubiquinone biosynthesis (AarF/ABC1/UbiB family)